MFSLDVDVDTIFFRADLHRSFIFIYCVIAYILLNYIFFISLGNECLPNRAADTADFLLFGDKLLDSVNGQTVEPHQGNLLRCAVRDCSQHVNFWYEAIKVLQSVKFFNDVKREFVPPTITKTGFYSPWLYIPLEDIKGVWF